MIWAKLPVKDGTTTVVGLTKANLDALVKQEVVLAYAPGMGVMVLVYAVDDETLTASVQLAHQMLASEGTGKPAGPVS